MPVPVHREAPTVLIRRAAWERSGLSRSEIDLKFNLTADEFRTEGTAMLEGAGLAYYDEFFELSGNWPEWLSVFAQGG
jgi:hypothetical protein